MRNHKKRLKNLASSVNALPIPADLVTEAYEHFRATGELPEHERLAHAVTMCAIHGKALASAFECTDQTVIIRALVGAPPRPADEIMDALYDEAVFWTEPERSVARQILQGLCLAGMDVTTAAFTERGIQLRLPRYGSVAMHMCGFEEMLTKRPYKAQAKRLFARMAAIAARVPQDALRWCRRCDDATSRFTLDGELPEDELIRDAVLALRELRELTLHLGGSADHELMAAFDAVARAKPGMREAALARLQERIRAWVSPAARSPHLL